MEERVGQHESLAWMEMLWGVGALFQYCLGLESVNATQSEPVG